MQQLSKYPVYIRCEEITKWVDEYTHKDLEYVLPEIVEGVFGSSKQAGWGLLNIEYTMNPHDYDLIFRFLNPNGPMFKLCYKLISDPYIKYKFPLSLLPQKIKESIEEGTASPFYMEKLEVDPRTRMPLHLLLNPFELYMFHFVNHVVDPSCIPSPYQETKVHSSLYLRLAEEYLAVFLPCDGSTVQPELPNHYISQSPHRSIPQKPTRSSTLFRQDVLMKMLKQSPTANTLQTSPHVGIWRSELIVQLCIDFWLSMPNTGNMWGYQDLYSHVSYWQRPPYGETATSMLCSVSQLPSCEHLHAVRLLVKHLHYFANSLIEDSSAMDQLKKVIIPSSQRKVYLFIRQTMQHWPLDSSFKQILEIWLSYIQPWRYLDFRTRYNRTKSEPTPVDHRWLPFIAENLLVYSVIFHELIDRFTKIELCSPKNSHMLFRLTKVLSQPNLCELLRQVEDSLGDMEGRGYSKWVQSHLVDFEGPSFIYTPILHSNEKIKKFIEMVRAAEQTAARRVTEERQMEEQMGLWKRLFSTGSPNMYSLPEFRNVPIFLSASIQNLLTMFQIPEDSLDSSTPPTPFGNTGLSPIRSSPISQGQSSPTFGCNYEVQKMSKQPQYEGDPDLQPIRSYENKFLVRFFYYICSWINYNYSSQLDSWYMRRDVFGGVTRQVLRAPLVVYFFDKRVPGVPMRCSYSLPPRLSLRVFANYYLLGYGSMLLLLLTSVFNISFSAAIVLFLFASVTFMALRWAMNYAPLVPVVSVHDVSDGRPELSPNF